MILNTVFLAAKFPVRFVYKYTTNTNWPEIKNRLLPDQDPQDCPDIVACVFILKVQNLLEILKSDMVFGKSQAWIHPIGIAKHSLPHCHLLLWLSAEHRINIHR